MEGIHHQLNLLQPFMTHQKVVIGFGLSLINLEDRHPIFQYNLMHVIIPALYIQQVRLLLHNLKMRLQHVGLRVGNDVRLQIQQLRMDVGLDLERIVELLTTRLDLYVVGWHLTHISIIIVIHVLLFTLLPQVLVYLSRTL